MFAARTSFYGTNIITDGLAFYVDAGDANSYPGSGTAWDDLTTNNFDLTLQNGPTFDSGNGGSIVFDGSNDNAFRNTARNVGNSFTASVWFNADAIGTTRRALIGNGYSYSSAGAQNFGWFVCLGSGATTNCCFLSCGRDIQFRISSAGTFTSGSWTNVTVSRSDGASTNIKIYKNGVETTYASTGGSLTGISYAVAQFYVGYRSGTTADPFDGKIAQTLIYNRVLSSDEILNNFNATRGRYGV